MIEASDETFESKQKEAEATNAVVVRKSATEEERKQAEARAEKAWEKSGRVASWGCAWYTAWLAQVKKAISHGQRLKAVFFAGQAGRGRVAPKCLPRLLRGSLVVSIGKETTDMPATTFLRWEMPSALEA